MGGGGGGGGGGGEGGGEGKMLKCCQMILKVSKISFQASFAPYNYGSVGRRFVVYQKISIFLLICCTLSNGHYTGPTRKVGWLDLALRKLL